MSPGCTKFKIGNVIVAATSIFMVNCKSMLLEPKHRFFSHGMLFIHRKPMLKNATASSKRMPLHAVNNSVAPRCHPNVPATCISLFVRSFNATIAKAAQSLFGIDCLKNSDYSARWTFNLNSFLSKVSSPARVTNTAHPDSSVLVLMSACKSSFAALWAGNFPRSVSKFFVDLRRTQHKWFKSLRLCSHNKKPTHTQEVSSACDWPRPGYGLVNDVITTQPDKAVGIVT